MPAIDCSEPLTYCTAPKPLEVLLGDSTPTLRGGRLLPAGGAKVFKRFFASDAATEVSPVLLPPAPPAAAPTDVIACRVRPTVKDKVGLVGSGTTSASTNTSWMPSGATCKAGEFTGGLLEIMIAGSGLPGSGRVRLVRCCEGCSPNVCAV